jgi:pimeloyl-ACP methyl ester carboxylesterase
MWLPVHDLLSRDVEVFAPDHPGFGGSDDLPAVEAIDDLVYHYLALMDRLGLERPFVVGVSFGAWIAAELAVHSPDRISKLALLSPIGLRIPGHPIADLFAMPHAELATAMFHDPSIAAAVFPTEPDLDFILQSYRDLAGFARFAWQPFMANPKLERRLHRVTAPTLVVWPDEDRVVPRAHAERYVQLIPGAQLEVIADCGHASVVERPDAVTDLLKSFLNTAPSSEAHHR